MCDTDAIIDDVKQVFSALLFRTLTLTRVYDAVSRVGDLIAAVQRDIFVPPPWILANGWQWLRSRNETARVCTSQNATTHESTLLGDLTGRIPINYLATFVFVCDRL